MNGNDLLLPANERQRSENGTAAFPLCSRFAWIGETPPFRSDFGQLRYRWSAVPVVQRRPFVAPLPFRWCPVNWSRAPTCPSAVL